jgi:peptidyl-prolyl cis-trans isomerase SurA
MKKLLSIIIVCLNFGLVHSIETKIIHNIQNEIITNIDIKNEFKYLLALNNNLKELDKESIFNISNESIIREKIKKIELLEHLKEIKISEEYSNILLKNIYLTLGIESLEKFKVYLNDYDLTLVDIKKKIAIEALWNDLIISKYQNQITIDEELIRKKIINNKKTKKKEYKLSEIFYEIDNKDEISKKYNEIVKSINEIGFKNSASIYSFSESSKIGGDIGWIGEDSLNKKIKVEINKIKKGEISRPIILPSGILILKLVDTKNINFEIDNKSRLKKAINYERDRQLSQFSKIYFNQVKKNMNLDE